MAKDNNVHHLERWLVPAVIVAFCAAVWWITTGFERMPPILKRGIQPSDFPQLVAALIVFLTILTTIFDPVRVSARIPARTWASMALMALFVLVSLLDFFLALAVFAVSLALVWGERRPRNLVIVGVIVPVGVFLLFDLVFRIRFPRGLLTNLWYG